MVGENLPGGVNQGHVDQIREFVVDGNRGNIIVVVVKVVDEGDGGITTRSGVLALASLIHVSFFGCIIDCDMAAYPGGHEAKKTFKVASIDRFD